MPKVLKNGTDYYKFVEYIYYLANFIQIFKHNFKCIIQRKYIQGITEEEAEL